MSRSSFRIRLWLGFGLMGVAIIVLGGVGLLSIAQLTQMNAWTRAASLQQSAAHEVDGAARTWIALLEGVAGGASTEAQRLDMAHLAVDEAIDAFEEATIEQSTVPARPKAAEEDDQQTERVAELRLMTARLALISSRLRAQGPSDDDIEQMAMLSRRFTDLTTGVEHDESEEVERAKQFAADSAVRARTLIVGITVGTFLLAMLVSTSLSRRLSQSVSTLLDATRRMSSGNLDIRTTLGGDDEFSALARGFTRMSVDLNKSIEQRERESAKAKQLAREAGVAYVTTGVLHNIGNALTSVNISLELLQGSGVGDRLDRLARVGHMLAEHEDDIEQFLLHDPKGSKLPSYLIALAPELERDAEGFDMELGRVRERVDHLVHILRAYQDHGLATLDYEESKVDELLEFAIDVALSTGRQTRYRIIRKVDGLTTIRLDKHRTLQILINLIRNASDAIDESGRKDGEIVVAAHPVEGTMLGFAISDNGIGIPAENIDKIFTHGFTTKSADDGSGFGLHASANAATEMGGRLLAHSDGPGKGAQFVLELPLEPKKRAKPARTRS